MYGLEAIINLKLNKLETRVSSFNFRKEMVNIMSMRSSFVYGFGFNCDCDEGKLIDFIKNHKETFTKSEGEKKLYDELLDYTENEYDLEDFFKDYECENNGSYGLGAIIANIMSRETGIRFDYCMPDDSCDTLASVVFGSGYPWQLNDIERNISEKALKDTCKKYMDEIGLIDEPDYLELEYFG